MGIERRWGFDDDERSRPSRESGLSMFLRRRASNLQSVIRPYMDGTIGSLAIRQISQYIMAFFTDPSIYVHAHNINY